jgi:hypothetical protein
MATRQRVDPGINPVITRPTAEPVNTYYRPSTGQVDQLVNALSDLDPKLRRFSQETTEAYGEAKHEEGQNAARLHTEAALKAGDLTRAGELPMQDNPYFMSGYKEEMGRVAAGQWQSDFKAALDQDPNLKESTDLKDFDKFSGNHLQSWFQQNQFNRDGSFEKGFGHMKDQYLAMSRLGFAEGIEKKLDKKSDELMFSMVKRSITDNWGNAPPEAIAADINKMVDLSVLRGRPDGKSRTSAAQAIAAAAEELGPEKGLQVLKLYELAHGQNNVGSLKDQSYGAELLDKTKKDLIVQAHQEAKRQREEIELQKQQKIDEVSKGAVDLLVKDPGANLEEYFRQSNAPPESISILRGLQGQWQDIAFTTKRDVYNDLYNRIYDPQVGEEGTTVREIAAKARNHNLRPEDAQTLISLVEDHKRKSAEDPLDKKYEDLFKLNYNHIENNFRKDTLGGLVPAENQGRVRNGRATLLQAWDDLKASGKAATLSFNEMADWFDKTTDHIIKQQQNANSAMFSFSPPKTP